MGMWRNFPWNRPAYVPRNESARIAGARAHPDAVGAAPGEELQVNVQLPVRQRLSLGDLVPAGAALRLQQRAVPHVPVAVPLVTSTRSGGPSSEVWKRAVARVNPPSSASPLGSSGHSSRLDRLTTV